MIRLLKIGITAVAPFTFKGFLHFLQLCVSCTRLFWKVIPYCKVNSCFGKSLTISGRQIAFLYFCEFIFLLHCFLVSLLLVPLLLTHLSWQSWGLLKSDFLMTLNQIDCLANLSWSYPSLILCDNLAKKSFKISQCWQPFGLRYPICFAVRCHLLSRFSSLVVFHAHLPSECLLFFFSTISLLWGVYSLTSFPYLGRRGIFGPLRLWLLSQTTGNSRRTCLCRNRGYLSLCRAPHSSQLTGHSKLF